jgi:hypothetical protein
VDGAEGLVRAVGVSSNRWEPANAIRALRTGLIDAVQADSDNGPLPGDLIAKLRAHRWDRRPL